MSSSAEVSARRPARWPWVIFGAFLAIGIFGLVVVGLNHEPIVQQVPLVIAFSLFGVVGAFLVSRDGRNVIGLLFVFTPFIAAVGFLASELTTWWLAHGDRGAPVQAAAVISTFSWLFGVLPILFLLPLLFPDGRLPSPRWRPFLWFTLTTLSVLAVTVLLGSKTMSGSSDASVANPLHVAAVSKLVIPDAVIGILFVGIFATSVVSLFLRFRRARGTERQQVKWVAYGLVVALVGIVVGGFMPTSLAEALITGLGFLAFPVSVGIAVLRFHLYDLDVVVRKTVVFTLLAVFATAVYLGIVVGLGTWLGRDNSFLTMVAAVVVALTFQPLRRAFDRLVNRLVYGDRATPYEVLSAFSERVGGTYEDADVAARMARVLGEGIGAERADVWLIVERELRNVAVWPPEAEALLPVPVANGSVPALGDTDRVWPVESSGTLLGALTVRKPPSDPLTPADEKLVGDLARQAGLVLRNVGLTEELKLRLEDLTAAQRRIVTAQDEARRRLERNIHDGAQQQLVALAVKARLTRTLAERDPVKASEMLSQIETETQDALENLRDLARGIYPPLLADKGLVAALQAQARKSAVPVAVEAGPGVARYPQDTEAAAYFCTLEALQNVAKYAGASRAEVRIVQDDGMLAFEVHDDGGGFDPSTASGTGLQGMADRLAAIGGTLSIISSPGTGTIVSGRIPVDVPVLAPQDVVVG